MLMLARCLLLVAFLVDADSIRAAEPPITPEAWQGRTLVTAGDVAPAVAISVSNSGQPLVVWADTAGLTRTPQDPIQLELLRGDGYGWQPLPLAWVNAAAIGRVDIEARSQAYVAYHDQGNGGVAEGRVRVLRLASNFQSASAEILPDAPASSDFDLAVAPNGIHAWLAFVDPLSGELRLQTRGFDGQWSVQTLPAIGSGIAGLALTDNFSDRLYLAYSSIVDGERGLRFAEFDGSTWSTSTLRPSGVSAGRLFVSHTGTAGARPAVLFASSVDGDRRVELLARGLLGVWFARVVESYGSGQPQAEASALGFDAPAFTWQAILRRPDASGDISPYRYARLPLEVEGLPGLPQLSDFGRTPLAPAVPASDQGVLAAVLGRGVSHAIQHRPMHADLGYFGFLPDWQVRNVIGGETGINRHAGTALTRDARGRPVLLAAFSDTVVIQRWTEAGSFQRSNVATGVGDTRDLDVAIGEDGSEHVVFRQAAANQLIYAHRVAGASTFSAVTLDSGGHDAQVHVASDGLVFISHADLAAQQVVVRIGRPGEAFERLVDGGAWPISVPRRLRSALFEAQMDTGEPLRRLVSVRAAEISFTEGRLRGFEVQRVGDLASTAAGRDIQLINRSFEGEIFFGAATLDIAMLDDGRALLALAQRNVEDDDQLLGMQTYDTHRQGDTVTVTEVDAGFAPFRAAGEAFELRVAVKNGALPGARLLARVRGDDFLDRLTHAMRGLPSVNGSFGLVETFAGRIDMDASGADYLAWYDSETGANRLRLAALTSPRRGFGADPRGGSLESVWTRPGSVLCDCVMQLVDQCETNFLCYIGFACFLGSSEATAGTVSLDDLGGALRQHFNASAAGRYYLDLWRLHANEIAAITRADPTLLQQRIATYLSFRPGLTALVEGRGGEYRMTPQLLTQARTVWQGWALAGSPALRADIENELSRLNDLNAFEGLTFDEWFAALSVGSAGAEEGVFSDGFEATAGTP